VIDVNDQCPNTIAGAEVNKAGCAIFETSLEGVNFETGSTNLTKGAKAVLDKVVEALKQFKSLRVEVQAHTDSVGKKENNQRLSDARAKSVVNYLVSKGITPERLVGKGYGETQPLVSNKSAKGRAQNRRVEFHVLTAETKTEKQD
ncbi:MAG: OmpA family protein, partial [Gammaproteobacteria bacterium]|nr:OmpA family protein [Gammaproteobacteria bacterium]